METGESRFIQVSASASDNKIQELAKKSQLKPITKFKSCKLQKLCKQSLSTFSFSDLFKPEVRSQIYKEREALIL